MNEPGFLHIHEDDWGLRQLFPVEALADALADMAASRAKAAASRDPSGFGWATAHQIADACVGYDDLGVSAKSFADAFAALEPRVPRFYATATAGFDRATRDPYGSYEEDALCFGDRDCFIKVDTKNGLATAVWYDMSSTSGAVARLRRLLIAAQSVRPSVLVDYPADMAGPIGDPDFMDAYFACILEDE